MTRAIAAAAALLCAWLTTAASTTLDPHDGLANEDRPAVSQDPKCDFSRWHPRRYAAFHLESTRSPSLSIDGKLDERAWEDVPWSEPFQDIRGPLHWSQPWFATRVKLLYDDEFLYVAAYLEEDSVWANVTRRNDVVFHDNDLEVFVDADGTTHNYKEVEVNALNTTWNLWLDRPYRNGGHENSTRVDPAFGFDMVGKGMCSAVFVPSNVNDPHEKLHYWTVEMALPLKQLALYTEASVPPRPMSYWRINFSRVEWAVRVGTARNGRWQYEKVPGVPEENWAWSSQYAVAMHRPEWWGYLQFRPREERPPPPDKPAVVALDPGWNVRYLGFQYYYAQHRFFEQKHEFAHSIGLLRPFYTSEDGAFECTHALEMLPGTTHFLTRIQSTVVPSFTAIISSDSLMRVQLWSEPIALSTID